MTNTIKNLGRTLLAGVVALAGAGALAGCQNVGNQPVAGEVFRPEGEVRSVHQFAEAQAGAGARMDGTLHRCHFDGGALNSLGQEKLDYMLNDDDAVPLVVRVNVLGDDAMADARRDAVRVYLRDKGIADDQLKLEVGPNKTYTFTAKDGIAGKRLLSSNAAIGTNPEPATGGGAEAK